VVEDAEEVVVVFHNGFWADADVVATDPQADLAVIQVTPPEGLEWRALPLADPQTLRVGHTVIAVGNPFGLNSTMTTGIVSALGRGHSVQLGESNYTLPEIIQTDAAINPGNSGGPLINLHGEVVGVNFAIQSGSRSNSGVGFSIPVSILRRVVPALIQEGGFHYPFLGIQGQSINPVNAKLLELPNNQVGVYVAAVTPGGPSEAAGIVGSEDNGDIITAINGTPVNSFEELVGYLVTQTSPNDTVSLTVLRNGSLIDVDVVLSDRPGTPVQLTSNSDREPQTPRQITARDAIAIAVDAIEAENLLDGDIIQKVAAPNQVDGNEVWVVDLSTETQAAKVTVDRETGEVLEIVIE
jgi:2-alkenal reductase